MSRRVYAVRDSFKDIVVKTKSGQIQQIGSGNEVMALSAMCSMVIGANLQYEVDEENDDDMDGTNFADELYEAVPLEYRRFVTSQLHIFIVTYNWEQHADGWSSLMPLIWSMEQMFMMRRCSQFFLRSQPRMVS